MHIPVHPEVVMTFSSTKIAPFILHDRYMNCIINELLQLHVF